MKTVEMMKLFNKVYSASKEYGMAVKNGSYEEQTTAMVKFSKLWNQICDNDLQTVYSDWYDTMEAIRKHQEICC